MAEITFNQYPQFFTATILEWKHLLANDDFKDIIIGSWQIQDNYERSKVQQSFLKYTAQQIKFELQKSNNAELEKFKVKASINFGKEIR